MPIIVKPRDDVVRGKLVAAIEPCSDSPMPAESAAVVDVVVVVVDAVVVGTVVVVAVKIV
jgi:hypothetical protein